METGPRDDEHPRVHEIGNRTYHVAAVEPLDLDGVRTIQVGTLLWALASVAMIPFLDDLRAHDRLWWWWTCLAGFGLGLIGWRHVLRRRDARRSAARAGES